MIKEAEDRLELYRMVFDAENYHLSSSHQIGYLSAEMIQFFFGGQLIKGAAKGVGKGIQFVKKAGELEKGVEGVKAVEVGVKEMRLTGKVVARFVQIHNYNTTSKTGSYIPAPSGEREMMLRLV